MTAGEPEELAAPAPVGHAVVETISTSPDRGQQAVRGRFETAR
jgi:hypothetical protein